MGLIHYLVVHQMSLVLSCYWIGWYIPVGDDPLTSFGSIWLHPLECRVHWLWALVFHAVSCQMILGTPVRQDLPLCCCPCHMWLCLGQSNHSGLSSSDVCFWSHVESHISGCSFPSLWFVSPLSNLSMVLQTTEVRLMQWVWVFPVLASSVLAGSRWQRC